MPSPVLDSQLQIYGFKGLNTNLPSDLIADEEFSRATNVLVRDGKIKKRMGIELKKAFAYSATSAGAAFGEMLFMGIDTGYGASNTATFYFYDTVSQEIYATQDFNTVTKRSGATAVAAVTSPLLNSIDLGPYFLGMVGAVDGLYRLVQFFGAGANPTLVSGNVSGFAGNIFFHQDRMWYYSTTTLAFSTPGDYTTLDTTSDRTITLPNNIDAAEPIGDKIILSTMDGMYVLNIQGGPRAWSLTKISSTSKGFSITESTRSRCMVRLDEFLYFLTPEGFFRTDGTNIDLLSGPIENEFDEPIKSFPDSINVGILSRRSKELLVKFPGNFHDDVNNQIKYYVYNTKEQAWTKLEISLTTPGTAPIFDPAGNHDGLAFYTYDLISFYNVYSDTVLSYPAAWTDAASGQNVYDFARSMQGMYAMSNWATNEPNQLYFFPEYEDEWSYVDGASGEYQSIVETKTFDLGYRGAHKKINKCFYTIRTSGDVDLTFTHKVNDTSMPSVNNTISTTERLVKMAGPGYFLEYALEIKDNITGNINGWELETISFDIINKSEQTSNTGSNGGT